VGVEFYIQVSKTEKGDKTKNIVDLIPNEFEVVISDLNKEDFIEDPEIYNYFVEEVFFKEFDEFIEQNYQKRKGKLKPYEDQESEARNGKMLLSAEASEKARKVVIYFYNSDISAKYVMDFDGQRQRFYLLNGKFYTYTINSLKGITPIIVHEFEDEEILKHLNVYSYMKNRSFFRYILDKLKE